MACASSCHDCSVCHEPYLEPKILPCGHRFCQKCVLSWVESKGAKVSCPTCRSAILKAGQAPAAAADAISAMPTDLYTASLVECQQTLEEPHVCGLCDNNAAAHYYCAQCNAKLCSSCEKPHKRIPATKSHSVEMISSLSAAKLAETHQVSCQAHPDRPGELYCPGHQQVICILCGTTSHGSCADRQQVAGMQTLTRKELDGRVSKLREKEAELARKVQASKDHLDSAQKKVDDTFDDIHQILNSQHKKFNQEIEAEKASLTQSLSGVEKTRAALSQNASCLGPVVQAASPGALLQMLKALRCRLDDLDQQAEDGCRKVEETKLADFSVNTETLNRLKKDLAEFGHVGMPTDNPEPQDITADVIDSEQEILREEITSLQTVNGRLQLRLTQLAEELKKTKEEVASKNQASKEEEEEDVPMAQRKRFTRVEMARVLLERNRYRERLMELQEAVRWTEMIRASREHPSELASTKKESSVWNLNPLNIVKDELTRSLLVAQQTKWCLPEKDGE